MADRRFRHIALRRVSTVALALALGGIVDTTSATASQLIDRNARDVSLLVNGDEQALLSYRAGGSRKQVLAWGAVNAHAPSPTSPQVKFRLDYRGKGFKGGGCDRYTGPPLPWLVAACNAPDGSYWAAQAFPQPLPDLGFTPWSAAQRAVWLELSHWTGPVPQLDVGEAWVYGGRYHQIYGRLIYQGQPVYGFHTTRYGAPLGGYGSLVYLDVLNAPAYGPGWRRENSFVTHNPSGAFCYGFYTFDPTTGGYQHPPGQTAPRGPGIAATYRLTAHGPGVTPDIGWTGPGLGAYDAANAQARQTQQFAVDQIKSWGERSCLAGHHGA
ncbi:MAG TPA: hypothetical protein VGJ25_03160 [Gaiellaceae bacterium]|jgi:hypothetical protein